MRDSLGSRAENDAAAFLESQGYVLLQRNFRAARGEVDIIAREGDCLCFIEVKARSAGCKALPQEAVSPDKQRRIVRTALTYLKARRLMDSRVRFDVVSILYEEQGVRIDLYRHAFEAPSAYAY
jgi:putative endonuclease